MANIVYASDYKIGGISQALGHVTKQNEEAKSTGKLEALFVEKKVDPSACLEYYSQKARPEDFEKENSRKRALDEKLISDGPSRKKQRENRKENREKIKLKKAPEDPDRLARTVFVGNIPLSATRKELKGIFDEIGKLETIRLRSVPVVNDKKSKKVAIIKKEFHPERHNMNAYIVFKDVDSVEKALKRNGMEYAGKHLRIDSAVKKDRENKYSVFVGNLPFNVQEEQLRERFSDCGEIADVRIIRDSRTGIGKGFGYVTFKNTDSVCFALKMNKCDLMDRKLRVFPAADKDNVKKPFNKKKDREHRLKDMKIKWKVGPKGKREENRGKAGVTNGRKFDSFHKARGAAQKNGSIKKKRQASFSSKMKGKKSDRKQR